MTQDGRSIYVRDSAVGSYGDRLVFHSDVGGVSKVSLYKGEDLLSYVPEEEWMIFPTH